MDIEYWENKFREWAKPPGTTERTRCENAEKSIRNAISASSELKNRNIIVFTQGSYRNNTNVRKDSDVDIGILCYDTFFTYIPEGYTKESFDLVDSNYKYSQFKDEVGEALISYFGQNSVSRGNKAYNIHENSYHVEADLAPFFEYRNYYTNGSYLSGVKLVTDNGIRIINWPEQHYKNGVKKNTDTSRRYKNMVRIIKSLCIMMNDDNIIAARNIPGFLLECLVWNTPNNNFGYDSYVANARAILAFLFNDTRFDEQCEEWTEVSKLKYLFRNGQKWTRQEAHSFISAAWDYIGYE